METLGSDGTEAKMIPVGVGSVKDIMVNTQTLAAATQILDQSTVNQGNPLQQSHTRILSPYKTYS